VCAVTLLLKQWSIERDEARKADTGRSAAKSKAAQIASRRFFKKVRDRIAAGREAFQK
jgi:hypothetical protein